MSNLWDKVKHIYADANQTDGYVEEEGGKYTLHWTSTRYSKPTDKQLSDLKDTDVADGIKLNALRSERNLLLQQSDWTQNRDVTLSNDADWKTYRQSLRDITKTYKSLADVKWPTEPTS
tara:strand:+ start:3111 stop:3467 length:357 start_codon:yes stop_codon:yes gene_type:complete